MKPNISIKDNCSLRNIQAITAEVAGIKKNTVTVLLAELFLIKNINIVNAPKDTRKILGESLNIICDGDKRELKPNTFGVARM